MRHDLLDIIFAVTFAVPMVALSVALIVIIVAAAG